ncbi:MAG: hypothetical protein V4735_05400 [Pseudomonadota bacterium]
MTQDTPANTDANAIHAALEAAIKNGGIVTLPPSLASATPEAQRVPFAAGFNKDNGIIALG